MKPHWRNQFDGLEGLGGHFGLHFALNSVRSKFICIRAVTPAHHIFREYYK